MSPRHCVFDDVPSANASRCEGSAEFARVLKRNTISADLLQHVCRFLKYEFYRPGPETGQAINISFTDLGRKQGKQSPYIYRKCHGFQQKLSEIPILVASKSLEIRAVTFLRVPTKPQNKNTMKPENMFFNFKKKQKMNVSFFWGNVNCMKFSLHVHSCLRIKQTVHGFKKIMTGIIAFIDCRRN